MKTIAWLVPAILVLLTAMDVKSQEGRTVNSLKNDASAFVLVEGGTFQMGDARGDGNEAPEHRVTVASFHIGRHEVTQGEWLRVMDANPSWIKGDALPVEQVTWHKAIEYCNKRSVAEGLTPCYRGTGNDVVCDWNATGYRLPTEAEWEYAARGGRQQTPGRFSGGDDVDAVAWHSGNGRRTTHPPGQKAPNALGLYDMSGNVYEWVWDRYGAYAAGDGDTPRGPDAGEQRILRGGSWAFDADCARVTHRRAVRPDYVGCGGLRLVRSVTAAEQL